MVTVQSRQGSANNPELKKMLRHEVSKMINAAYDANIDLSPVKIYIWIKQYGETRFYPKIEFDYNNQELQYDMDTDGQIAETHYKTFLHNGIRISRKDIEKSELGSLLTSIDDLVKKLYASVE